MYIAQTQGKQTDEMRRTDTEPINSYSPAERPHPANFRIGPNFFQIGCCLLCSSSGLLFQFLGRLLPNDMLGVKLECFSVLLEGMINMLALNLVTAETRINYYNKHKIYMLFNHHLMG